MQVTFADVYGTTREQLKAEIDRRRRANLAMRPADEPRGQCRALTHLGHRCRWRALPHFGFCGNHQTTRTYGTIDE